LDLTNQIKKYLVADLELSEKESDLFLALMKQEKTSSKDFKKYFNYSDEETIENSKKLEQKGMVIEIEKNQYRALHPRFAAVNRYKRLCEEKNEPFKKNVKIDNIGIMLEKLQNS
jgi:predicted transcriptional regulator